MCKQTRRQRVVQIVVVSLLFMVVGALSPLYAQGDCRALISDLEAFLKADSLNRVDVIVTTNQSDRGFASVTIFPGNTLGVRVNELFSNGGTQFFSDRGNPPFSAEATDKQGIRIFKGRPARVELILESHNNGVLSGVPLCSGNVMFGSFNAGNGAFSVSFKKGRSIP